MKTINLLLTTILLIISVSVWSQEGNTDIVKKNYPEVYTSILQAAEKQWGNNSHTKQTIIEGQAQSFLEIVNSPATLNADIMTEAIINNSVPGSRNSNITIINDLSIKNPFPHLKCDWYKVKTYYEKRAGSLNNYASTNSYDEVLPSTITIAVSEQEKEYETEIFTPAYTAQDKESTRRDTRYENTYSGSYEAERNNVSKKVQLIIRGGINFSAISTVIDDQRQRENSKTGYNLGLITDIRLSKDFYLQPGLELIAKGSKLREMQTIDGYSVDLSMNALYLQLPVVLAYKISVSKWNNSFNIGLGPYFAYGIGGKMTGPITTEPETFGDEGLLNRPDVGLTFELQFEMPKVVFNYRSELGLANIVKKEFMNNDSSINNWGIYFGVGYKF